VVRFCLVALLTMCSCQARDERMVIFDAVCDTVRETYFDPGFGGVDLDAACAGYRPRVASAVDYDAFYTLLNDMLWELGVSHVGVGPLAQVGDAASPYMFSPGTVGLDVRVLDGRVVISGVRPGSPARRAGLRPGIEVRAIDGVSVREIMDSASGAPPLNSRVRRFHQTEEILRHLFGPAGTFVSVAVSGESDEADSVRMERVVRRGAHPLIAGTPPVYLETDTEVLDTGIGYLRFNAFQPARPDAVVAALVSLREVRGLVIDLRGNNGGSTDALRMIAARLIGMRFVCGAFVGRERRDELVLEPEPGYAGPIAVLVDEMTISAGELFPACLREAGRAVIVGNHTPGMVVSGNMTRLSEEVAMVSPDRNWLMRGGAVLEGEGVLPDVVVALDRQTLLAGGDNQLEAAIAALDEMGPGPKH